MTFELNQVVIDGEEHTFSFIAQTGQMICITGGTAERRQRWLLAMMGFLPIPFSSPDVENLKRHCRIFYDGVMNTCCRTLLSFLTIKYFYPKIIISAFLKTIRFLTFSGV